MEKLDKTTWLTEGFKVLESDGFTRITVDYLCERQNRSKGSFYFHFKNIDGYIEELMKYWIQEYTINFIEKSENKKTPAKKYKTLTDMVIKAPYMAEQAIRAWGYSNSIVRESVQKVDKIRLEYVVNLKKEAGNEDEASNHGAILEYAILIGIQQLYPDISKGELLKIYGMYTSKINV
ncbi:MAG: TetR/AcrR family transcriptional regulator [Tannerellaceae bacterium]|jgi:AcrR family transcriptional regulator|nr:TetR/AcrR family transcriptional regulator [Tannerellaceae bacterium]